MDHFLYGGDYNPEQWLDRPDILSEDIALMKKAHVNTVTLGVFAWSMLEPKEGEYSFRWLEDIIDNLYENGISTILATPSGARPRWLADRYPEVLRVNPFFQREHFGGRHNQCLSSPAYRERTAAIDTALAERFDKHPAVILWHISNELGGECRCPLCREAFRAWLRQRYGTIDNLNRAWNTIFWSHVYDSFSQVESPSPIGEKGMQGLHLDWKRFVTDQTVDFTRAEIAALKAGGAKKPCTTNFMYHYQGLDYRRFKDELDLISWDNYPIWHKYPLNETAGYTAFQHDFMRSVKKKNFLLMESCPSATDWQEVSHLKEPGLLSLQSYQAIAHGSQSVLYFQWRQAQAGPEKLHGSVVDHTGRSDTRVFSEVADIGETLERIPEILDTETDAKIALLYDVENEWAIRHNHGPRNCGMHYYETLMKFYRAVRRLGADADILGPDADLSGYALIIAPMLYLLKEENAEKLRAYVRDGGKLLGTFHTGIADEEDKCYLGEIPHHLTDVFGMRHTETDGLFDGEENELVPPAGQAASGAPSYACRELCEIIEAKTAETLLTYGGSFYKGTPALTVNAFGKGTAWYLAANAEEALVNDLVRSIVDGIDELASVSLPEGLEMTKRSNAYADYFFFQNFTGKQASLPEGFDGGCFLLGENPLPAGGTAIVKIVK